LSPGPGSGLDALAGVALVGVEGVEAAGYVSTGTLDQRPVVALDHRDEVPHDPRQLEDRHPGPAAKALLAKVLRRS